MTETRAGIDPIGGSAHSNATAPRLLSTGRPSGDATNGPQLLGKRASEGAVSERPVAPAPLCGRMIPQDGDEVGNDNAAKKARPSTVRHRHRLPMGLRQGVFDAAAKLVGQTNRAAVHQRNGRVPTRTRQLVCRELAASALAPMGPDRRTTPDVGHGSTVPLSGVRVCHSRCFPESLAAFSSRATARSPSSC